MFAAVALMLSACASASTATSSSGVAPIGRHFEIPAYAPVSLVIPNWLIGPGLVIECGPGSVNSLPSDQVDSTCSQYKIAGAGFVAVFTSMTVDGAYPSQAELCADLSRGLSDHGWKVTTGCESSLSFHKRGWHGTALLKENSYLGPGTNGSTTSHKSPQITMVVIQESSVA